MPHFLHLFILGTTKAAEIGWKAGGIPGLQHHPPSPTCQNRHPQICLNSHILEIKFKFSFDLQGSLKLGLHRFLSFHLPFIQSCSPPELSKLPPPNSAQLLHLLFRLPSPLCLIDCSSFLSRELPHSASRAGSLSYVSFFLVSSTMTSQPDKCLLTEKINT